VAKRSSFIPISKTHPKLARQAYGWRPTEYSSGSNALLKWQCTKNKKHIWTASLSNRSKSNTGCPYCKNKKVLRGDNDLKTTHPELAKEAYGWDPTSVNAGSKKGLQWKCRKNPKHIWVARPANRNYNKTGCPFCFGLKVLPGDNDLATHFPKLAKEANGWDPRKTYKGTARKLKWRCSKDKRHVWIAKAETRTMRGYGCPYCSGKKLAKNSNDLKTTHPRLAKEAYGWDPKSITAHSTKRLKWRCVKNSKHVWIATPSARNSRNSGCPFCVGKAVALGDNDLKTKYPSLAKEAYGWDPRTLTSASGKKRKWKCKSNPKHIWITSPAARTTGLKNGCPYCANRRILKGDNDLKTTHPKLAQEAYGWDPSMVTAGMVVTRKWRCKKNPKHIWSARVDHRTRSGTDCPDCAVSGFHNELPGYIYLLSHPKWKMFQIGITNYPKVRLSQHVAKGWRKLEIQGPMDGKTARNWERAILKMLRNQGVILGDVKIAGNFDGYTEAWSKNLFMAKSISDLKRKSRKYLS
jgi:hypothetical protein